MSNHPMNRVIIDRKVDRFVLIQALDCIFVHFPPMKGRRPR